MLDIEDKLILLAKEVSTLKKQTTSLSTATETITKLEGPQGIQGIQGPKGDQGDRGFDGVNGKDGIDGKDGKDGLDGKDGAGIVDAEVDFDGSFKFTLDNGKEINTSPFIPLTSNNNNGIMLKQQYAGPNIFVQATEPVSPAIGDIWFDIS